MKNYLIILFLLIYLSNYGQEPTAKDINTIVTEFLKKSNSENHLNLKSGKSLIINKTRGIINNNRKILSVVELSPIGFVVVSNNKSIEPIIAYSYTHNFNYYDNTEGSLYQLLINDIEDREMIQSPVKDNWAEAIISLKSSTEFQQWPPSGATSTGGWIETTWNQRHPYNSLFPTDPITGEKVLTGCVATAFAQLLNYHKTAGEYSLNYAAEYTSTGLNNAVIHIDEDYQKADFASFEELNEYLNIVKGKYVSGEELSDSEVSALNFLAAIMVKANFSSSSTSANISNIPLRLKDYFKYESCEISSSVNTSILSSLKNNMKLALPALLSVQNPSAGGHLIICDGYNTNNFFHLNFGWGPNSPEKITDVWYNIPQNIPANYNILNSVIYNIKPQKSGITVSTSLIELFPDESLSKSSFTVTSEVNATLKLESEKILLSADNNSFSNSLNLSITEGSTTTLWVSYTSVDSTINDQIKISLNDKVVEYIDVKGFSNNNTIAPGRVSGIWDDQTKPYLVTGNVYVDGNDNLTIEKGVTIYFTENAGLIVQNGRLLVQGEANQPVVFTTLSENYRWEGIEISDSENDDIIRHAVITNSQSSGISISNSDPKIINCFIANNYSEKGGGLYFQNSKAEVLGCIIVNNFTDSWGLKYGGGLYAQDSEIELINSTFNRNRSVAGGALYATNSIINLTNSILWDNYASVYVDSHPDFIHKELSFNIYNTSITAINCIIKDFEGIDRFGENYCLNNLIDARNVSSKNPSFIKTSSSYGQNYNPQIFNWRLKKESCAINNGTKVTNDYLPDVDFYGNPRIKYQQIDIGAAESIDSSRFLSVSAISELEFPTTFIDSSSVQPFQIKNSGVDSVWISLNLNNRELFSCSSYFNQKGLGPGDSINIDVTYAPHNENVNDTAYLVIYTTSDNFVYEKIRLTGTSIKGKPIKGEVFGTWESGEGPYIIIGDTWIKENSGLEIESGTQVLIAGNYSFSVSNNSELNIKGNYIETVNFEGIQPWKGFNLQNCVHLQFIDYLKVTGVKGSAAIQVVNTPVRITNSEFSENENCIRINNGSVKGYVLDIRDNFFFNNSKNIFQYKNTSLPNQQNRDTLLIINNTIHDNKIYSTIKLLAETPLQFKIDNNSITDNFLVSGNIEHYNEKILDVENYNSISENIIANNSSEAQVGISIIDENTIISNNLIVHNDGGYGSILINITGGNSEVLNNTVAGNSITISPVYISVNTPNIANRNSEYRHLLVNNIFYKNSNSEFRLYGYNNTFNVDYNLCNNSYTNQANNFNTNPDFSVALTDTGVVENFDIEDWHLKISSACIDAGNPDQQFFDKADPLNPGSALFPALGTITNDLGAFGGNNCNYYDVEYLTICEGDSYFGHTKDGTYYEMLQTRNGKDSLITIILDVIESDLAYSEPQPTMDSNVTPGKVEFSWTNNSKEENLTDFKAFYSLDKKSWSLMYDGSDNYFSSEFESSVFSGKTVYWYIKNYDSYCPRESPVWSFNFDIVTSDEIFETDQTMISVLPNPNNGQFKLDITSDPYERIDIKIFNSAGTLLYSDIIQSMGNTCLDISLDYLPKGIYYLKANTNNEIITEKIILN